MKNVFLILSFLLIRPGFSVADHINVSGNVSGTWETDTVFVDGPLTILNGQTLTVMPGVSVIFNGFYKVVIAGRILSQGSPNDSISYTIADTTGFYMDTTDQGAWNGIWFDHLSPANDSSLFEYCVFSYGKAIGPDSVYRYGGAICLRDFNRIRISNCRFYYNYALKNGGAIYATNSNPIIRNCLFHHNSAGTATMWGYGGAVCLEHSEGQVQNNTFRGNSSTGVGGGLSFEYSDPLITANIFESNFSAIGGGLCGLRSNGVRPVSCNLLMGNGSVFYGGGMGFATCSISILNNTVVGNYTSGGGGMFFNFESFPLVQNNIVWGNYDYGAGGPQVYIWDALSAPEFYFNNIQGGVEAFGGGGGLPGGFIGVYEDNIDADPLFSGISPHYYNLNQDSPCTNAGIPDTSGLLLPPLDLAGHNRVISGRIDIGAFEFDPWTLANSDAQNMIFLYPNPSSRIPALRTGSIPAMNYHCTVYDGQGSVISRFDLDLNAQHDTIGLDQFIPSLNPGSYLLVIIGRNFYSSGRFIISD